LADAHRFAPKGAAPVTPIGLGRLVLGGLRRIIEDIIRQSRRTRATVLNPRVTRTTLLNPRTTRARVPGYEL
jgi:hypothetical protein